MVQWLGLHASTVGDMGSIPSQGTNILPAVCGAAKNQKRKSVHKHEQVSEVSCSLRLLSEVHLPVLSGTGSSVLRSRLGVSSSSLWIIFGTHFSLAKGRERWPETEARERLRKETGQRTSSNTRWPPSLWHCSPTTARSGWGEGEVEADGVTPPCGDHRRPRGVLGAGCENSGGQGRPWRADRVTDHSMNMCAEGPLEPEPGQILG